MDISIISRSRREENRNSPSRTDGGQLKPMDLSSHHLGGPRSGGCSSTTTTTYSQQSLYHLSEHIGKPPNLSDRFHHENIGADIGLPPPPPANKLYGSSNERNPVRITTNDYRNSNVTYGKNLHAHTPSVPLEPQSPQKLQCFKTKKCRFWMERRCSRGAACTYAHTDVELRIPPNFAKTKICTRWQRGVCTKLSDECCYAHGYNELRSPPMISEDEGYEFGDATIDQYQDHTDGTGVLHGHEYHAIDRYSRQSTSEVFESDETPRVVKGKLQHVTCDGNQSPASTCTGTSDDVSTDDASDWRRPFAMGSYISSEGPAFSVSETQESSEEASPCDEQKGCCSNSCSEDSAGSSARQHVTEYAESTAAGPMRWRSADDIFTEGLTFSQLGVILRSVSLSQFEFDEDAVYED